jgi:uncharacterized small protein (TIGR04563 family)
MVAESFDPSGERHVPQKRKVTLYFNSAMLAETQKEAIRQDRSVSWIIQAAWRIARDEVKRMPGSGLSMQPPTGPDISEDTPRLSLHAASDTPTQA